MLAWSIKLSSYNSASKTIYKLLARAGNNSDTLLKECKIEGSSFNYVQCGHVQQLPGSHAQSINNVITCMHLKKKKKSLLLLELVLGQACSNRLYQHEGPEPWRGNRVHKCTNTHQALPAAVMHRQGLQGPWEAAVQKPGAMSPSLRAKAGQLCPPSAKRYMD